jgi:hypothetical protein
MYGKQVHERSPLRLFERSIHGGLGKGNIGVVASRAGTGKTSFLVGIALDDLMRGRPVCHVAVEQSVEHVREYYDEVFNDLAKATHLEDVVKVHVDVERGRHIHTFLGHTFSMVKFREMLSFLREHLHFEPEVVVLDGFEFGGDHYDELNEMREIVGRAGCELWMSARTHRDAPIPQQGSLPSPLARYQDLLSVVVSLESVGDTVRLRLLKDHENTNISDLYLDLDPQTMLVIER